MSQNKQQLKLELKAIRLNTVQGGRLPGGFGVVTKGALAALVEVATIRLARTPLELAQRYQQALAVWWQEGAITVLPVRAGAIFEGPETVAAWLQENAVELEQSLARLDNKVEMGLRLVMPTTEAYKIQAKNGLEYMQQLARREAQLNALEVVISKLGCLADDYIYEAAPAELFSPRAAFLVSRSKLAQFILAVQTSAVKGVLTGPVPPFSFV